jgi:hypothetical protein
VYIERAASPRMLVDSGHGAVTFRDKGGGRGRVLISVQDKVQSRAWTSAASVGVGAGVGAGASTSARVSAGVRRAEAVLGVGWARGVNLVRAGRSHWPAVRVGRVARGLRVVVVEARVGMGGGRRW